jgi:hypothetical protein
VRAANGLLDAVVVGRIAGNARQIIGGGLYC